MVMAGNKPGCFRLLITTLSVIYRSDIAEFWTLIYMEMDLDIPGNQ